MAERMKNVKMPNAGPLVSLIKGAVVLGAVGYGAYNSFYNVQAGERAIVFSRITGVGNDVKGEGTHLMLPWLDRPIIYDVRTRPRNIQSLTGSRDLQMVNITIRTLTKPEVQKLPWIYRRLGMDFDERVLPSIVNEVAKEVVAQFNASELITKREFVSRLIRDKLVKRGREFGIYMDDVSITHLSFGRDYTAAVESKQVAEQDAERAKYIVDRALQEKKGTVIRAQGQAKAAELVGDAIKKNPAFVELRRLDVAKDIATTMSRSANKVYLDSDTLLLSILSDAKVTK
jgi:prohibitin 2